MRLDMWAIQVGSALAYRGIPLQAAYCGAKHAIRGFTDSLRTELIHDKSNIRVSMVQLPAVNTPQFDWARTHRSHQPRPVAPVVEPEAVARAIFRAYRNPAREIWVGWPTFKTILGSMLAPAFLDRYLATRVFGAQDRKATVKPGRADNLFAPVSALHRTRGSFTSEASDRAIAVSSSWARATAVAAGLALIVGFGGAVVSLRQRITG